MNRAVFLDRDGVLNRAMVRGGRPYPPASLAELEILPGVPEALEQLRQRGFFLIGVTNQPDVARGTQTREVVEAINARLIAELSLDEIRVCHEDTDDAVCRKPNPGMLLEAAQHHSLDLPASWMVGDRWRDIEAGRRAGCRTVFIDRGYDERRPDPPAGQTVADLPEAVNWILAQPMSPRGNL